MIKFKSLRFKSLPNDAHCGFFADATKALAEAGSDVKDVVEPLDKELDRLYVIENDNLKWYRKSTITAAIVVTNRRLGKAMTSLSTHIKLARRSPHPTVAAAAEALYVMLHSYGTLSSKSYLARIADVGAILSHLTGELAADVQTAGVAEWIPEITATRNELAALLKERDAHSLEKPKTTFKEVRKEIEKVWHQITVIVNGGVALHFSKDFEMFINSLNPEIERLNNKYHHAKINIALSEPAPVPVQKYTGYPCTPALNVLLVTPKDGTIKLELGKDYNVTYKHNINVGNAECTIHGKGAYKGRKTVTFSIERT